MDELQGESDPPPARSPLNYAGPRRERLPPATSRSSFGARFAIGFFGYVVFSVAWFWGGATRVLGLQTSLAAWTLSTIALLALALYLRVRHGYSGIGYGILTVLGICLLIVGAIFLLLLAVCGGAFR